MLYKHFKEHIDSVLKEISGKSSRHWNDAPWRDLFNNTARGENVTKQDILETQIEWDSLFAYTIGD